MNAPKRTFEQVLVEGDRPQGPPAQPPPAPSGVVDVPPVHQQFEKRQRIVLDLPAVTKELEMQKNEMESLKTEMLEIRQEHKVMLNILTTLKLISPESAAQAANLAIASVGRDGLRHLDKLTAPPNATTIKMRKKEFMAKILKEYKDAAEGAPPSGIMRLEELIQELIEVDGQSRCKFGDSGELIQLVKRRHVTKWYDAHKDEFQSVLGNYARGLEPMIQKYKVFLDSLADAIGEHLVMAATGSLGSYDKLPNEYKSKQLTDYKFVYTRAAIESLCKKISIFPYEARLQLQSLAKNYAGNARKQKIHGK